MVFTVYLHDEIADVLQCFGDLNEVTDRILSEAMNGKFSIENLPKCPPRQGLKQYSINVTNEEYIEMVEMYGKCNKTISLRRILYFFVENEMYEELGWQTKHKFCKANDIKYTNLVAKMMDLCVKLYKITPNKYKNQVLSIRNILGEIVVI